MSNLKEGTKVRIIETGFCYTTFAKMFEKLGFHNKVTNYSDPVDISQEFVIFNIGLHPDQKINLYAVQNRFGQQLLISERGLEIIPLIEIEQLCITYPNDMELGAAVRLLNRQQ